MSRVRPILIGAAALSALALVCVPVAASGHTDNLYTWAYVGNETDDGGFATTSKSDAALALLPTHTGTELEGSDGMEICNEQGYSVSSDGELRLSLWDHTTGALGATVNMTIDPGTDNTTLLMVGDLDTTADCSLYAVAVIGGDESGVQGAVVSINVATGLVTTIATFPSQEFPAFGLATNPVTGITYLFNAPGDFTTVAEVDLAAGLIGTPADMDGIAAAYSGSTNFSFSADFDAAGGLWIASGIDNQELYYLNSYAAGDDLATAVPRSVGVLPYYGDSFLIYTPIPLTTDAATAVSPAAPALADTGVEFPTGLALLALLLVGAGAVLTLTGRRRTV